jgi:protein SCO1/2
MKYFLLLILSLVIITSCTPKDEHLPILGNRDVLENGDTLFHTIPDFSFVDQDSNVITNETFENKIYIVDFFFIHCPSICPTVSKQMLRIYERFEDNPQVVLLAHSIDTKNDTIPALKEYANKLGVKTEKWHFVTGDHDQIYEMADDYFVTAMVDPTVPGGFDHSGRIILIDKNRHVRSFCDGTNAESVNKFLEDIEMLLNEEK